MPITLKGDKLDLEIRLKPIELPADLKTYPVLGMQLADVTPELRSTYDLYFDVERSSATRARIPIA